MIDQVIAASVGRPTVIITDLLNMSPEAIYESTVYQELVSEIDNSALHAIAGMRPYLDEQLPPLVETYKQKYQMDEFPLTGLMLCNWVLGFANMTYALPQLLKLHENVSRDVMREVLPEIMDILEGAPDGVDVWKKTFAIFVIPLVSYEA